MHPRTKHRLWAGLILGFAVVVGVIMLRHRPDAPSYQRKGVRAWVLEAYAGTNVGAAFAAMGPKAIPALVELLHTQELPFTRKLHSLAPKLPSPLRGLLGKPEMPTTVKLRCGSARCLGLLGPQAESAAGDLFQAMRDPELAVRSEAASALAQLGKPAVPYLALALQEKDLQTRRAAAFYLGRMGPTAAGAVPALALALQDKEAGVRIEAADALRRIGQPAGAAVSALIQSLEDPDPSVRTYASTALAEIGAPNVRALVALINRGDLNEQKAATKALIQNYRALRLSAAVFRKLAGSGDPAARELAVETLGMLRADDDLTVHTLATALKDPEPKVRLAAAKSLQSIPWKARTAIPALTDCLADASPAVQTAVKEALDRIRNFNR